MLPVGHHRSSRSPASGCGRRPPVLRCGGLTVVRESPSRLRAVGELDVVSAPWLSAFLADPAVVELDVSGISFIDASGVSVLVGARGAMSRHHLRLLDPSSAVVRILELCGEVDAFAVWT